MGDMIDPMGEGRNPPEELKGWKSKRDWQEAEVHSPGKCHVSGDKLVVVGKTKKKGLSIWASELSDGSLLALAARTTEEKQAANEANDKL